MCLSHEVRLRRSETGTAKGDIQRDRTCLETTGSLLQHKSTSDVDSKETYLMRSMFLRVDLPLHSRRRACKSMHRFTRL